MVAIEIYHGGRRDLPCMAIKIYSGDVEIYHVTVDFILPCDHKDVPCD